MAKEVAEVRAGEAWVQALEGESLHEVRGQPVKEEELVELQPLEALHGDGVDGERRALLLAQAGQVLQLRSVLVLQARVQDPLDANDLELGRRAVRLFL